LLSSGGDQIFPKGLPVGTVSRVSPGKELFLTIKVKPADDLSRLEEVLVVTEKREHEPVAESSGRVRAADILAQRLPSVPDKPSAPATGATPAVAANSAGSGAGVKPQPTGAPMEIKNEVKSAAGTPAPSGSHSVNPSGVHNVTVVGQPVTGEVLKKAVQKSASGDSGTDDRTAAASSKPASSKAPGPNSASSNPADSAAKPATAQPKIPNPKSTPQPSASQDDPH
jgi:rod shape-determining protein MreC